MKKKVIKRKIITAYSKVYPFTLLFLLLASTACIYTLSKGNLIPYPNWALIWWSFLVLISISSYACKNNLRKDNGEKNE